jgi:hypothetical protein
MRRVVMSKTSSQAFCYGDTAGPNPPWQARWKDIAMTLAAEEETLSWRRADHRHGAHHRRPRRTIGDRVQPDCSREPGPVNQAIGAVMASLHHRTGV